VQRYNISDNRQNITGLFCGKNEIRNTIHYIYNTRANKQRGRKDEKRQEETGKGSPPYLRTGQNLWPVHAALLAARKKPYTGSGTKRRSGRGCVGGVSTQRAAMANAACCDDEHSVLRRASRHAAFLLEMCSACLQSALSLYFLDRIFRKIPLQHIDSHRKSDLSACFSSGAQKCHRARKRPPNRMRMRRILTKVL